MSEFEGKVQAWIKESKPHSCGSESLHFHEGEYAAKNSLNFEIRDVLTKAVEN